MGKACVLGSTLCIPVLTHQSCQAVKESGVNMTKHDQIRGRAVHQLRAIANFFGRDQPTGDIAVPHTYFVRVHENAVERLDFASSMRFNATNALSMALQRSTTTSLSSFRADDLSRPTEASKLLRRREPSNSSFFRSTSRPPNAIGRVGRLRPRVRGVYGTRSSSAGSVLCAQAAD